MGNAQRVTFPPVTHEQYLATHSYLKYASICAAKLGTSSGLVI